MKGKYKLFGKIPVVDILVVLVLVAVMAAALWLLTRNEVQQQTGADAQVEQTYPFTAVFMVSDTAVKNVDLIEVGDELYLKGGTYVGKVTAVRSEPYVEYNTDALTGEQVGTELGDRANVYLTVDGVGTADSDKGIFVLKKRIAYNSTLPVGNEKYYWTMRVVDVRSGAEQ